MVSLKFYPRFPRNELLHAPLSIIIIIDLSCALCYQAPRLWALTYVSAGGGGWFVEFLNERKKLGTW